MAGAYAARRARLQTYFDADALKAWADLTSKARVSRIRETVRQGRDEMRANLLALAGEDLTGRRLLDAGCGTGALAAAAAARGADVLGVDIAPNLLALARERAPRLTPGRLEFTAGDMIEAGEGSFDVVVLMDSLIHYELEDMLDALERLAGRARRQILFTFAPETPLLALMHAAGRIFPRGDRAPAIVPIPPAKLRRRLQARLGPAGWRIGRGARVSRGFYISEALELARP